MRKLASNGKAVLFKCGKEYWIVERKEPCDWCPDGWHTTALNERSDTYNASHAIAHFTETHGAPTWTHKNIEWY